MNGILSLSLIRNIFNNYDVSDLINTFYLSYFLVFHFRGQQIRPLGGICVAYGRRLLFGKREQGRGEVFFYCYLELRGRGSQIVFARYVRFLLYRIACMNIYFIITHNTYTFSLMEITIQLKLHRGQICKQICKHNRMIW